MKIAKPLIILIICTIYILPAFAGSTVATVGGSSIKQSALEQLLNDSSTSFSSEQLSSNDGCKEIKNHLLNRLIDDELLSHEAKKRKMSISKEEFNRWLANQGVENPSKSWIERQKKRLVNSRLLAEILKEKIIIDEKQIEEYYKNHKSEFSIPANWHVKEISIKTRDAIKAVFGDLKKGRTFEEVAKEYSVSDTANDGGDIGFVSAMNFPDEIIKAFKSGPINSVTPAFSSPLGYQIFLIVDSRPSRLRPLEDVRDDIIETLQSSKREEALKNWFDGLKTISPIKIDEENLKEIKCYNRD